MKRRKTRNTKHQRHENRWAR